MGPYHVRAAVGRGQCRERSCGCGRPKWSSGRVRQQLGCLRAKITGAAASNSLKMAFDCELESRSGMAGYEPKLHDLWRNFLHKGLDRPVTGFNFRTCCNMFLYLVILMFKSCDQNSLAPLLHQHVHSINSSIVAGSSSQA